jgi:hypothetical protein
LIFAVPTAWLFRSRGREGRLSKPVAYTEEQVRHWLAFLARNMQSHGQSVFLVEQLQPSWLTNRKQIFAYLLLSRAVIYGGMAGLVMFFFSLGVSGVERLPGNLMVCFAFASGAVVLSLPASVFAFLRTARQLPGWLRIAGLTICAPFAVVFRPVQWVLQRHGRTLNDEIQTVEQFSWSWRGFWRGLVFLNIQPRQRRHQPRLNTILRVVFWILRVLMVAGFAAAIAMVCIVETDQGNSILSALEDLFAVVIPVLISGFFSAVQPKGLELKATPNLGIVLSGRNASIVGAIGLAMALVAGNLLLQRAGPEIRIGPGQVSQHIFLGLVMCFAAFLAGVPAVARFGGVDFLSHYCLRLVMRWSGHAPLRYVRFLDYAATELGFLQKVGGGYVFMHRYLMEYFATSEEASSVASDRLQPV